MMKCGTDDKVRSQVAENSQSGLLLPMNEGSRRGGSSSWCMTPGAHESVVGHIRCEGVPRLTVPSLQTTSRPFFSLLTCFPFVRTCFLATGLAKRKGHTIAAITAHRSQRICWNSILVDIDEPMTRDPQEQLRRWVRSVPGGGGLLYLVGLLRLQ